MIPNFLDKIKLTEGWILVGIHLSATEFEYNGTGQDTDNSFSVRAINSYTQRSFARIYSKLDLTMVHPRFTSKNQIKPIRILCEIVNLSKKFSFLGANIITFIEEDELLDDVINEVILQDTFEYFTWDD